MADYEKVVGMLGENSASFLELSKKLLVDWGIDPKKILHLFQNIRKDDLVGLLSGTHEIRAKKKTTQTVPASDGKYFEQIFESDYMTVPDMATLKRYANKKWGDAIASVAPSMALETGMKKKIKVFGFKKDLLSQCCINFIKSIPGAILPNVFGLAFAEMTVGSQLPRDKWILGLDNYSNLSLHSNFGRRVSLLCHHSNGYVDRGWLYWDREWSIDYCLVLLCD